MKILLYGGPKTGKTKAALSFPRPAVIDSENGAGVFVGQPGLEELPVMVTQDLLDAHAALEDVRDDETGIVETLIVDSISVFYDQLVYGALTASQAKNKGSLRVGADQWNIIHASLRNFYGALATLAQKVNVVMIAREVPIWELGADRDGRMNMKRTEAVKIQADPLIRHWPDMIVRLLPDHRGQVEAVRGVDLKSSAPLPKVDYETLMRAYQRNWSAPAPAAAPAAAQEPLGIDEK